MHHWPNVRLLALVITTFATLVVATVLRGEDVPASKKIEAVDPAPAASNKVDPTDFVTLDAAPVFRESIPAKDWDKRFKAAIDELGGLAKIEQSKQTEYGELVVQVNTGSKAIEVGLLPGDVVSEVDGQPIRRPFYKLRTDQPQTMTVCRGEDARRVVPIQPGRMGFGSVRVFRPDLFFVHQGQRDPKWDELVLIGAAFCRDDPDLSETAFHRAIDKGYKPDALSDVCGAHAAWRQGRIAAAQAFAHRAATAYGAPSADLDVLNLNYALGIADMKIEQAMAGGMLQANPKRPAAEDAVGGPTNDREGEVQERAEFLQRLLKEYRMRDETRRLLPVPPDGGPAMNPQAKSILKSLESDPDANDALGNYTRDSLAQLTRGEAAERSAPADHFSRILSRSNVDASDVRLTVHATLEVADNKPADYDRDFHVSLVDSTDPNVFAVNGPPVAPLLTAYITPEGTVRVEQGSGNQTVTMTTTNVGGPISRGKEFTLRLIHAHGRDEAWIDKQRLLYMPAEQNPARIGMYMTNVGTKSKVKIEFDRE